MSLALKIIWKCSCISKHHALISGLLYKRGLYPTASHIIDNISIPGVHRVIRPLLVSQARPHEFLACGLFFFLIKWEGLIKLSHIKRHAYRSVSLLIHTWLFESDLSLFNLSLQASDFLIILSLIQHTIWIY